MYNTISINKWLLAPHTIELLILIMYAAWWLSQNNMRKNVYPYFILKLLLPGNNIVRIQGVPWLHYILQEENAHDYIWSGTIASALLPFSEKMFSASLTLAKHFMQWSLFTFCLALPHCWQQQVKRFLTSYEKAASSAKERCTSCLYSLDIFMRYW